MTSRRDVAAAVAFGAAGAASAALAPSGVTAALLLLTALSFKVEGATELYYRCQATGLAATACRCCLLLQLLAGGTRIAALPWLQQLLACAGLGAAVTALLLAVAGRWRLMRADHTNPRVQGRNRLPAHAALHYDTDPAAALAAAAGRGSGEAAGAGGNRLSLDGWWEFELRPTVIAGATGDGVNLLCPFYFVRLFNGGENVS